MGTLWQDLRYALRTLAQRPGFTAVVVLALALGIGANTAIFSVVHAVVLRPLPYPEPERLVMVWENNHRQNWPEDVTSYSTFTDWKEQGEHFEAMSAFRAWSPNLTGSDEPERLSATLVTADFFTVLGVAPALGRTLRPDEDKEGNDAFTVLGNGYWQRRFGGDPTILGKSLVLNGTPHVVIGVMPAGFDFPSKNTELWVPLTRPAEPDRGNHGLRVVGRLKKGTTLAAAEAQLETVMRRLEKQDPQVYTGFGSNLVDLHEQTVGPVRPVLLVLLGAVLFVLLIACANVANLLLARTASRDREIAIRTALGASGWRLVRQLLTESVVLGLLGGTLGLLLALWGTELLVKLGPGDVPRLEQIGLDGRMLLFTLGVSLLTGLLFGLAPALSALRPMLNESLKETKSIGQGMRGRSLRGLLVVAETALALVLLIGAGLMLQSLLRLQRVDPGFRAEGLLSVDLTLPRAKYTEEPQLFAFGQQLVERLQALPGVASADLVMSVPLGTGYSSGGFTIEGRPEPPDDQRPEVKMNRATPGYFKTMGIPLVRGRAFQAGDTGASPMVVVINEAMSRKFWPEGNALGARFKWGRAENEDPWREVVGVVADIRQMGLDQEPEPEVFMPYLQDAAFSFSVLVRTDGDPASLGPAVRREVQALDTQQPVYNVRTMESLLAGSVAQRRFSVLLLGLFSAVALALAALGIYGVLSYTVHQRTREIGIRMALGARRGDVLRLVLGQGLRPVLFGVILGLAAAFGLSRVLAGLLYGIPPTDPATYAGVAAGLGAVAVLASLLPARRAAKVDPMIALRYE